MASSKTHRLRLRRNERRRSEDDGRFNKLQLGGLAILARGGQIKRSSSGFLVRSQSTRSWYEVLWDGRRWSCQCRFNRKTHGTCKHIYAILFEQKFTVNTAATELAMECPSCQKSDHVVRHGWYRNNSGLVQRLLCTRCGRKFTDRTCFEKMKHNSRIIVTAMDLYFKGLSYRKISSHLKETYGVNLTHVAVFNWVRKYLTLVKRYTNRQMLKLGRKWHCDEMQYNVAGNREYVWNLMDAKTRFLLACRVTRRRRKVEARAVFAKGMKTAGSTPRVLVTDGLSQYASVARNLRKEGAHVQHINRAGQNNRVERLNQTLRERTKTMRVNSTASLARFATNYPIYYNFLRRHSAIGKTPAQAAKVEMSGGWFSTIRRAALHGTHEKRLQKRQDCKTERQEPETNRRPDLKQKA